MTAVLAAYPVGKGRVVSLGSAGGFSGAAFWKVETADETLCVRRWPPEHPSTVRLHYIHAVLQHVFDQGITQVALPRRARSDATFVAHGGHLWEVSPWMPGAADYHRRPARERLAAAMRLLARFHLAAATFGDGPRAVQPAPGIRERLELTDQLIESDARQITATVEADTHTARKSRARRILQAFVEQVPTMRLSLTAASQCKVNLQPCLRDVWHDHVLFSGDDVTGLVDFGALRDECVSADVARLLGSLVRDDQCAWDFGLQMYQQCRNMTENETALLDVYAETSALLSGMNWLRWIYLERRQFDDSDRVLARMDENLESVARIRRKKNRTVGVD